MVGWDEVVAAPISFLCTSVALCPWFSARPTAAPSPLHLPGQRLVALLLLVSSIPVWISPFNHVLLHRVHLRLLFFLPKPENRYHTYQSRCKSCTPHTYGNTVVMLCSHAVSHAVLSLVATQLYAFTSWCTISSLCCCLPPPHTNQPD